MGLRGRRFGETVEEYEAYLADRRARQRTRTSPPWRARNPGYKPAWRAANRERNRDYDRRAYADPERGPAIRERKRISMAAKNAARRNEVLKNNDGRCELCGVKLKPLANGKDGRFVEHRHDNGFIRGVVCCACNMKIAVADLRFSDPVFWEKLIEWSSRGLDGE